MGVKRTAISSVSGTENTAQVLMRIALDPKWKDALSELSASKADHDKSREAANLAKQTLSDAERAVAQGRAEILSGQTDLAQRAGLLAQAIKDHEAQKQETDAGHDARARALQTLERNLTQRGIELDNREKAVVSRETALIEGEADLKSRKRETETFAAENRAAIEAGKKLFQVA